MSFPSKLWFFAAVAAMSAGAAVKADERYKPVRDAAVIVECGACHMAFQPQMLPKRSWAKIMDNLSDHFGENASLDNEIQARIRQYYVDNSADSGWVGGRFLRGLPKTAVPLRITETPHWIREHRGEVPERAWRDPRVKSKANCMACHRYANRGGYDDD